MRRLGAGAGCVLVLLLGGRGEAQAEHPVAVKQDLQSHFEAGNKAYLDADYGTAVAEYEKVLDAGVVHPDLYFNLANAQFRAGRKGLAVLFYEKALDLDPGDASVVSNLGMVRRELIDRVVLPEKGLVGEPQWQEFVRGLPWSGLTYGFLALYLLAFGIGIARRFMADGPGRRVMFWLNVPVISLALCTGLLLASRIYVQERVHHGVVIAPAAALLEGPERTAKQLMEVHEGLKVRLLSVAGDYIRVRLANGVEGFLQDSQLGQI